MLSVINKGLNAYSQLTFDNTVSSSLGGDITAILLRQRVRIKALLRGSLAAVNNPVTDIIGIPITVITQENWNYEADVSQFPLEDRSIISDHIVLHPMRVSISFEVSNWDDKTAKYAMELLEQTWLARQPVELQTAFRKLTDMVMINFDGNTTAPEWGRLQAQATFQKIGKASLTTVTSQSSPIEKVTPTDKTGGPDVSKSAMSAIKSGASSVKSSTLSKLLGLGE